MKYVEKILCGNFHDRLVNGSDYPLVNMKLLNLTLPFYTSKLISSQERALLNEIYEMNPLLYDIVLKRTVRGPNGERLPASIFVRNKDLRV